MATSGFMTFVIDSTAKTGYVNSDAYPSALGVVLLDWLAAIDDIGPVLDQARHLRMVDGTTPPTPEEIERLQPFGNLRPDDDPADQWYWLLRHTQGNPDLMLQAGVVEDASDMLDDPSTWYWGYRIDLDDRRFAAYHRSTTVVPFQSWPFADLPTRTDFLTACAPRRAT